MTEKEWVNQYLRGSPRGWEDLFSSGRVPLDELDNGNLKKDILNYLKYCREIQNKLRKLEYEAG